MPTYYAIPACLILLALTLRLAWRWRRSALCPALVWALLALAGNVIICWLEAHAGVFLAVRYFGLVLALCVPVAVLGARFPTVIAWHFVVLGFLAVASLPILEQSWASPEWWVDGPRTALLGTVIIIAWINYLPTRLGWVVSGLAWSAACRLVALAVRDNRAAILPATDWCVVGGLWWAMLWSIALWCQAVGRARPSGQTTHKPAQPHDSSGRNQLRWLNQLWLEMRDAWGLVWAWRVREMVQSAAYHAQLPGELRWRGLYWPQSARMGTSPTTSLSHTQPSPSDHEQGSNTSSSDDRHLHQWLHILEAVIRRFAPPSHAIIAALRNRPSVTSTDTASGESP